MEVALLTEKMAFVLMTRKLNECVTVLQEVV